MLKTGFRGERKRILTPFTYSPIRRLLQRRGECSDGKSEGNCGENVSLFTYPAVAGYLQKGKLVMGKANEK